MSLKNDEFVGKTIEETVFSKKMLIKIIKEKYLYLYKGAYDLKFKMQDSFFFAKFCTSKKKPDS